MTTLMDTPVQTTANRNRVARAEAALCEVLAEATRRGFWGTASIEVIVADGAVQRICRRLERVER